MGAIALLRSSPETPTSKTLARSRFRELEIWLAGAETLHLPLHQVEVEQEKRGREIMRLLLQDHLDLRGEGDVGRALEVLTEEPDDEGRPQAEVRRHGQRRHHVRHILSVFGKLCALRLAYFADQAGSVHPLDEAAWLPKRIFGYELQRRVLLGAVQGPFDEALERAEESTGNRLSKRSAEDLVRDAAIDFDSFYSQRQLPPAAETGPVLVASVDCKGIPMVKPQGALRVIRRTVGTKANKKRMATVAAVFTQKRRKRRAEEIVERLFYEGPRLKRDSPRPRNGPEHKRVWASVELSKDEVFAHVVEEVEARDPDRTKQLVLLMDGERVLQQRLAKLLPRGIEILDLMHVMGKLWKAAFCFYDERSAEARQWVRERTLRLLKGEVSGVVQGMKQIATKRGLSKDERKAVDDAARYFRRNRHRMRYDEYLKQGLPIASGAVEGACKNLVKDRMERSGMRWTIQGAEAMVRLRAVYLSGDFDDYWAFHIRQEQHRLYPPDRWRVVEE